MNRISWVISALLVSQTSAHAFEERQCVTTKFGLNNSDEICATTTHVKNGEVVKLNIVSDVATYDPEAAIGSRNSVADQLCKLFKYKSNVALSMTFRKVENAGFIGGGAVLGGGAKKVSAIDTIRCRKSI
ncbi:MAG: hypothetical protein JST80_00635 [Bdellovibrionales bacterium]|nr:hypothetical protein [Bdellovibrionales bacterium]